MIAKLSMKAESPSLVKAHPCMPGDAMKEVRLPPRVEKRHSESMTELRR